jgi:alpha-tubulin suppressor-like RCC1 family protein
MPSSSRSVLRSMLVVIGLLVGPSACMDFDLSGLDEGSGTGCYLCYPDTPFQIAFDSTPVAVAGGLTFSALSVGSRHVCGLTPSNGAWCWGARDIGTTSYRDVASPMPMAGTVGFVQISAGESFNCGLDARGRVSCWGINGTGALGIGVFGVPVSTPVPVQGELTFRAVSTSGATRYDFPHSCALTAAGVVWCWGGNDYGQLGNGGMLASNVPVAVLGGHIFESISAGAKFTCGIVRDNGAFCWGQGTDGQLGNDPRSADNCASEGSGAQLACSRTPVHVPRSERFTSISAGVAHACALDADGAAWCWGANHYGQLGVGTTYWSFAPIRVVTSLRFLAIATGSDGTCALSTAGEAFCWGSNTLGQLGDGTTRTRLTPTKVVTDVSFAAIAMGVQETCALTPDGAAWCWGSNENLKLGKGS